MTGDKVKVLYTAGFGRSGSTILNMILGEIDGFFFGSELSYVWKYGLIENTPCGCDVAFKDCALWQDILNEAFGGGDQVDAHEMIRLRMSATRTHQIPLLLLPGARPRLASRLQKYLDNVERFYRAIQSSTGCKVILDSSKHPSHAYLLGLIPSIDLYFVHLVRDSRAVAFSWLRNKRQPFNKSAVKSPPPGPVMSSLRWVTRNLGTEALLRRSRRNYMMLRYEDFARNPQASVERILGFVQEERPELPFVANNKVELGTNHGIWGNPDRFNVGTVELRPDEDWKTKMEFPDKATVTTLSWPLLLKYGYL